MIHFSWLIFYECNDNYITKSPLNVTVYFTIKKKYFISKQYNSTVVYKVHVIWFYIFIIEKKNESDTVFGNTYAVS